MYITHILHDILHMHFILSFDIKNATRQIKVKFSNYSFYNIKLNKFIKVLKKLRL